MSWYPRSFHPWFQMITNYMSWCSINIWWLNENRYSGDWVTKNSKNLPKVTQDDNRAQTFWQRISVLAPSRLPPTEVQSPDISSHGSLFPYPPPLFVPLPDLCLISVSLKFTGHTESILSDLPRTNSFHWDFLVSSSTPAHMAINTRVSAAWPQGFQK